MPSLTQTRYLERASRAYHDQFKTSDSQSRDSVIAYLGEHGITGEIAQKYRLGFVADPLPGDERFRGALVYPYLCRKAPGVAAIRFRLFHGDSKIGQHKGQHSRIYNALALAGEYEEIGLVEGEPDTMAASEYILPTVGIPGVKNFKDRWLTHFKDFTRVHIFAQGDQRGREFGEKMADLLSWRANLIECPDGEDVASLAGKGQIDILKTVMSTSNQESE